MRNHFESIAGFFFQFGQRTAVPETFEDELMRQCHSITLFCSFIGFFLWLPYINVDALNHPGEGLLPILRLGATSVSLLSGILIFTPIFRDEKRHGFLLVFMYAYLLIAVGVITGISGADAPYMGGYCVVILGSIIAPLPKKYSLPLIYSSGLVFFSICFVKGIRFKTNSELYSLTDLIVIFGVTTIFTFILNRLRYKNYIKSRQTADYADRLDKAIVEVETSHENMLSSLRYASLIQMSMLPNPEKTEDWFKGLAASTFESGLHT